jgi:predicted NAD/FAD-binding protein
MAPKRIAIVGSGCSGIGALWALKNSPHEVHLYEAADRLGGHTNTVEFRHGDRKVPVDTGFIVMNTATYRQSSTYEYPFWTSPH